METSVKEPPVEIMSPVDMSMTVTLVTVVSRMATSCCVVSPRQRLEGNEEVRMDPARSRLVRRVMVAVMQERLL